jgi:hypothetical protein
LPPDNASVGQIAGRIRDIVNNNPTVAAAGPEGLSALIWSIAPEDPAKMDPAKQAEAMLARANITSADSAAWAKVLENFRIVAAGGLTQDEAASRKADAYLSVVDLGKINQTNFGYTEFATRAGLSFGTFSELRGQGFNAQQIMNAAGMATSLGISVNT